MKLTRILSIVGFLALLSPTLAGASVISASYEGSTAYSPAFMSGSNGYSAVNFTLSGSQTVKALIVDDGGSCDWYPVSIKVLNGPGTSLTTATNTATIANADDYGHSACIVYFGGGANDPGVTLSAGTYTIVGGVNTPGGGGTWYGAASGAASVTGNNSLNSQNFTAFATGGERAYAVCTTSSCDLHAPVTDTTTHLITVTPAASSTIATSTTATFGASGYINPNDYTSGMFIHIEYAPYSSYQASIANPDALFTKLDIPLTSSGTFHVSTTSPATTLGLYTMQTSIRTPSITNNILNFFGFGQFANFGIKTATSTQFTAAQLSGYDIFVASTSASLYSYLASSTVSLSSCTSWTSFNLGDCLSLMLVPQTQLIGQQLANFKNGFLTYFPWGYVTRFMVIMSGSATSTLPTLTIDVPIGAAATTTLTFDEQDIVVGGGALLESVKSRDGSGKSMQDIVEPWIQSFVALFVILIIVRDLLGMQHQAHHNFHNGRE